MAGETRPLRAHYLMMTLKKKGLVERNGGYGVINISIS